MEKKLEYFPDGTAIDEWFYDVRVPEPEELGKQYLITDYGILDDGRIYTKELQALIDRAHSEGGGVIVVPAGVFMTGSLFFRQGVNLYVSRGGVLRGSDDPSDYALKETRIEGETCTYFAGLINAENLSGFTMCGPGSIDGNGMRAWKAFWLRRAWNPACTNKDEQRPRLVFISNCTDVLIAGLSLQNSHFWTTHIYHCRRVKYIGCNIYAPYRPVKAPSTDAIDIDVCTDVLVKNCCMHVNDDSVVLKGGKGPWADSQPENGINERIIVEDCVYRYCHGCLTCGSESVHNRNIIVRRVKVMYSHNMLWLKMRPDTPQHYEYITIENVEGRIESFICVFPWTQFYDLKGRKDKPLSYADHITIKDCDCDCSVFYNVKKDESQYRLSDFDLENLHIRAQDISMDETAIENLKVSNLRLEQLESSQPITTHAEAE